MSLNNYIPPQKELKNIVKNIYPTWIREAKQNWTNCSWEMLNYIKKDRNIRLFVKKSFLKWDVADFENDYKTLKSKFKNIIPNQWFIQTCPDIFAFCSPINIKIDIFNEKNDDYLLELLKSNDRLLKQIKFFIKNYEDFLQKWMVLDLYWNENLVISDDDKLYYIDSFLVFHRSSSVINKSIKNINFLKEIVLKVENELNKK